MCLDTTSIELEQDGAAKRWAHFAWAAVMIMVAVAAPVKGQRSLPAPLFQPQGETSARFGSSVALDGDTVVVGAPNAKVGANDLQGAAYVYRWTGSEWALEASLVVADGEKNDHFGNAVAISGDTIIVGAYWDQVASKAKQGSAYVFTRVGGAWTQRWRLTASDGLSGDNFGTSVAIQGDVAVVGSPLDKIGANFQQGSAYIFQRHGADWAERAKLTAVDGAAGDQFGVAVAVRGDIVAVGASMDDQEGVANRGAAYVFVQSGDAWSEQSKLVASDGGVDDRFGNAVAISAGTILVGASFDHVDGDSFARGAAYVYRREGAGWIEEAKLTAPGGQLQDYFGSAVALEGDTAVIGSNRDTLGAKHRQGSVFAFRRSGATWTCRDRLTASASDEDDTYLGSSVAFSGDTIVTGAPGTSVNGIDSQGSAWVFSRVGPDWIGSCEKMLDSRVPNSGDFGEAMAISGDTLAARVIKRTPGTSDVRYSVTVLVRAGDEWLEQASLVAPDGAGTDLFGAALAISGDTMAVGAPRAQNSNGFGGRVYVFVRVGTEWKEQGSFVAPDGSRIDEFGSAVAISGDTIVVGVPLHNIGSNADQGAAYIYTRAGATWSLHTKLIAPDGAAGDNFGSAVAIDKDTVLVGANQDDVRGSVDQGSVYVFTRSDKMWKLDTVLTGSDASGGSALDRFGSALALSGEIAVVGAPNDGVGLAFNRGSAHVFARSGGAWTEEAKLVASDGAKDDFFGNAVAISGNTVGVGARGEGATVKTDERGAVYLFKRTGGMWPQYAKFTAPDASALDALGTSVLLAGEFVLAGAPTNDGLEDTPLSDEGAVYVFRDPPEDLSVATNTTQNTTYATLGAAMAAAMSGDQVIATEPAWRTISGIDTGGRSIDLSGVGDLRWPSGVSVTLGGLSSLRAPAGAVIEVFGDLTARDGATVNMAADDVTVGSRGVLAVRPAASVTINAKNVQLLGSLDLAAGAELASIGNIGLATGARVSAPFVDATVRCGGNFDARISNNARFDLATATMRVEGAGAVQDLEVMSTDIGPDPSGLDRTLAGHYPIGTLRLGPAPSIVRLSDRRDNDGLGQASCEAVYVRALRIDSGSRLVNPTCRVYYRTLVNHGTVDVPANLVRIGCSADYNWDGGVDDFDLFDFMNAFNANDAGADFNADTSVDDSDYVDFINAFGSPC